LADTKIVDLTEKATGAATDEFLLNDVADGNTDKKMGMDGLRITQSQITDTTITATNLNILDDAADTTLHFHDADRARANHTGTQLASTISDFDTQVQTSRLDQMAAPTAAVLFNGQNATNIGVGQGDSFEVINAGAGTNPTLTSNSATNISGNP